jgi:tRNA threonylcarbamoyladenosine modification (KEOPS) complex  Pcc1 subunit
LSKKLNDLKVIKMAKAEIIVEMDSNSDARIIIESITPEIKNKIPNTTVKLYCSNNKIFLNINSKNLSSLRAACNSYLRWINTANNVKNSI